MPASDYSQKRNVLISSGDAPEIIPKTYPGQETNFVTSGQILAASDYVKYMPNYQYEVKAWNLASDLETIKQSDGKYYVLPMLHEEFTSDYSLAYRADIFKKNNIAVPTTWDEWEAALKKLKAAYPNITPWSDEYQLGSTFTFGAPAWGLHNAGIKTANVDWASGAALDFDTKAKKFFFYPTSDQYKSMLTYFNKLVSEGLLDKESATQTDEQAQNKFINGQSFVMSSGSQYINTMRTKMDSVLGKGNYEVAKATIPAGPAGANLNGTRLENGILLTKKAGSDPNYQDLLKFVDWLWYSKSGQTLCKWGVEGETYTKDNGKYKFTDQWQLPAYGLTSTNTSAKDIRTEEGYGGGNFILSYGGPKDLGESYMPAEDLAFNEQLNKTHKLLPNMPTLFYTDDQREAQNLIQTQLMDYVYAETYKFVLGTESLSSGWSNFVKACESKGSTKFVDTANQVYKNPSKSNS